MPKKRLRLAHVRLHFGRSRPHVLMGVEVSFVEYRVQAKHLRLRSVLGQAKETHFVAQVHTAFQQKA